MLRCCKVCFLHWLLRVFGNWGRLVSVWLAIWFKINCESYVHLVIDFNCPPCNLSQYKSYIYAKLFSWQPPPNLCIRSHCKPLQTSIAIQGDVASAIALFRFLVIRWFRDVAVLLAKHYSSQSETENAINWIKFF